MAGPVRADHHSYLLDWMRALIDDLASGRLTWDREQIARAVEAERRARENGS